VVFGEIVPVKDHTHLHWTCPFCGSPGLAGEGITTRRVVCSETDRGFLVVGIPDDFEPVSGPGPSDLTRRSRGCSVRVRESDLEKMIEESRIPAEEAHHAT